MSNVVILTRFEGVYSIKIAGVIDGTDFEADLYEDNGYSIRVYLGHNRVLLQGEFAKLVFNQIESYF